MDIRLTVFCILFWWTCFICSLPIGVKQKADLKDGVDAGAPEKHHIPLKIFSSCLITGIGGYIFNILFLK